MRNDSIIAFRTREQLRKYLGIFSPQFMNRRWKMEFLGQMLFGIQAARDTLMSEIARSLQEDILAKKTQERLERHLAMEGMDTKIHGSILCDAAPGIRDNTLVIIDPSDVQKRIRGEDAVSCQGLGWEQRQGWEQSWLYALHGYCM